MKRDMSKLIKSLRLQGWVCALTRSGHWRCQAPDGSLYFASQTPSDHRAIRNTRADLRRLGADL